MKNPLPSHTLASPAREEEVSARGRRHLAMGWPYLVVWALFTAFHLAFQIFALLQSYIAGMAHFDDPLSRKAAWESTFWENATTVATFPLVRLWEQLPEPWRVNSYVEWGFLAFNSLLWGAVLVLAIRLIAGFFIAEEN